MKHSHACKEKICKIAGFGYLSTWKTHACVCVVCMCVYVCMYMHVYVCVYMLYTIKSFINSAHAKKTQSPTLSLGSKYPYPNFFHEKEHPKSTQPIPRYIPVPIMKYAYTCLHFQSSHQMCICKKTKSNTIPRE